jgi:heme/copper-type cytochrome/quinol oxidase subunit 2
VLWFQSVSWRLLIIIIIIIIDVVVVVVVVGLVICPLTQYSRANQHNRKIPHKVIRFLSNLATYL